MKTGAGSGGVPLAATGAGAGCGAGFVRWAWLVPLLSSFFCLSFAEFRAPLDRAIKLPLQITMPSKRRQCVEIVASYYRLGALRFGAPRPAGLPPGGTKRLDVSEAFGFGLPPTLLRRQTLPL